jgi:DnaK suppressor protein
MEEGMDQQDLQEFKDKLLEAKEAVVNRVQKAEDDGREADSDGEARDLADQASSSYAKELLFRKSSSDRKFLQLIDQALDRLETGDYGECQNCEEPIGLKRIQAVPWARLCIKCQELEEQGGF